MFIVLKAQHRISPPTICYNFTKWRKSSPFLVSVLQLTMTSVCFRIADMLVVTLKWQTKCQSCKQNAQVNKYYNISSDLGLISNILPAARWTCFRSKLSDNKTFGSLPTHFLFSSLAAVERAQEREGGGLQTSWHPWLAQFLLHMVYQHFLSQDSIEVTWLRAKRTWRWPS